MKSDESIEAERAAMEPLIGPTRAEWYADACCVEYGAPTAVQLWACRYREVARELARTEEELRLWRPLTDEEAQAAYDAAEAVPLSEAEIDRILKAATDPATRLPNSEQAQLAARAKRLEGERAEHLAMLTRVRVFLNTMCCDRREKPRLSTEIGRLLAGAGPAGG